MPRQNIQNMTPEQMAVYVETVRARNRLNAKNYYDNKIKTDPEKYEKFKLKCAKASKKYYSRADYRLEQAEEQALLRFFNTEEF
jgi:predicted solute-binding protein